MNCLLRCDGRRCPTTRGYCGRCTNGVPRLEELKGLKRGETSAWDEAVPGREEDFAPGPR